MRHQHTELPHNKFQRKQWKFKPRQSNSRNQQEHQQYDRINEECHKQIKSSNKNKQTQKTHAPDVVIPPHMQGFRCPAEEHQCKYCKKIGHFSHMCFKKPQEQTYKKGHINPKHTNYKIEDTFQLINSMIKMIQAIVRTHSASKGRSNQSKLTMKVVKHSNCLLILNTSWNTIEGVPRY